MSDKFLNPTGNNNLTDGTADIFINRISINDADIGKPLKTNSQKQVVGGDLEISDINNLTYDLVNKTQLEFTEQLAGYVPQFGHQRLYFKTDGNLYKLNSGGVETEIGGGGGGGISYDAGSVVQGNGINFRNGTDTDKIKNASGFALVNLPAIGDSLLCNDIQFPSIYSAETTINDNKSKLTKITYDPVSTITAINGELDVDKIKNTNGSAEVELETDGKINMVGSGKVKIQATSTIGDFDNALSLETGTNCYITATKGIYLNALNTDNTDPDTPNLTLNASYGRLTIQAINGYIQNLTQGLIRLENIPPNPVVERNGFIFNPDAVRVDFNKLDVSKGYLGLDAGDNLQLNSTTNSLTLRASSSVDIIAQNADLSLTAGGNVLCYNSTFTDGFAVVNKNYLDTRLSNLTTTTPFNLVIAGTDEVNLITTTGQKMEIYAPATITLNRVAFSTTQAGGTNFSAGVYQNGTLIKEIILGSLSYSDQAITPITITKGDIIHLKVINVGSSTATGLKCNLEGVYQ